MQPMAKNPLCEDICDLNKLYYCRAFHVNLIGNIRLFDLTLLTPRQDKFVPRGSYIALNIHF